jgi:hypothetical protein
MADGQQPGAAGPALDKATQAKVQRLQEQRRDVLRAALAGREKLFQTGQTTLEAVVNASNQLLNAELEMAPTDGARIAAHQRHFEKARMWHELTKVRQAAGRGTAVEALEAQAVVLAAEIGLLKAGGKLKDVAK